MFLKLEWQKIHSEISGQAIGVAITFEGERLIIFHNRLKDKIKIVPSAKEIDFSEKPSIGPTPTRIVISNKNEVSATISNDKWRINR